MTSVLPAVRAAYQAGLCPLPVCEDGSKAPDVSSWTAFKATRPTVETMRAWQFETRVGYGVLGGAVSGHIDPWDFDCAETFETFVTTAHACGLGSVVDRIRGGYEDRTPTGGRRWLARYPEGATFADVVLAARSRRPDDPGTRTTVILIEITTFSILAPSNGPTHPSGDPYVRVAGEFSTIARYTVDEREGLLELARSFDQLPRREARATRSRTTAGIRPGDDYNRRMTWPTLLEAHGWTHVYERGETSHWRRPGKTQGMSATTNHAGSDLFYPFSSSTVFEPDTSYSKFGVYAALVHGGNYAKAAKQLAAEGYGDADTSEPAPAAGGTQISPESSARLVRLTPASEITIRPVRWLWEDRLSLGSLSLLGGREGVGKTIVAYTLAAALTRGRLPGVYQGQPRSVLVAATEDSWEHTITPRLMAANADLTRVYRVDVVASDNVALSLSLPQDVIALEQAARDVSAAAIVLDPLLSRLDAHLDTHKDAEVRRALEPLSAMADAADVTVLGLIHVNKSASSDALSLLMASRAFPAVARNVLFAMVDPDNDAQRLLGQAKNNLGRLDLPTLVFQIENTLVANTPDGLVWTGQLRWLPSSDRTLRHAIERAGTRPSDRTVMQDAAAWLEDYLTSEGGKAAAETVLQLGRKAGHSRSTLYLAKRELNLASEYREFPRVSYWLLSSSSCPGNPGTTEESRTTDTQALASCPDNPSPECPDAAGTTSDVRLFQPSLEFQRPGTTGTAQAQLSPLFVSMPETSRTGIAGTTGTSGAVADPFVERLAAVLAAEPRREWELAAMLDEAAEVIDRVLRQHPDRFVRVFKTADGIHRWACVKETGDERQSQGQSG